MATGDFSIGAYIVHDRWRHDLVNDHYGDLSTLGVIIEQPIGPYGAGTPLQYVLEYLIDRMLLLEGSNHGVGRFTMDAYILAYGDTIDLSGTILGVLSASAVKFKGRTGSFTMNARRCKGFTMDAVLRGASTISVDAVIV